MKKSDERHRLFFENAPIGIIHYNRDGVITDANEAIIKIFCSSHEKLIDLNLTDILDKTFAKEVCKSLEGKRGHFKGRYVSDNRNKEIYIKTDWIPIIDGRNVVAGVGIVEDLTTSKQTEEALQHNKELLQSVFESIQDGISILDKDLTVLHVNSVMKRWYADRQPLEGSKCYICYHGADMPCNPCPTLRCLESGKTEMEILAGPPKSDLKWLEVYSYPLRDSIANEITGVVEFVRDITERKRMETVLHESEERYRGIVEDLPALVCSFLPDSTIVFVNRAYCEYFERTPEELIGVSFLTLIPEPDREGVMTNILSLTPESPTLSHEHQVLAPDGTVRWQRWIDRALFDKKGNRILFQAIGEDITEQKLVAEEHEKLQGQLIQAQKMESVGRLAGGVAHDFNNMLGVIIGNTEMALEELDPSEPLYPDLIEISKAAKRSANLTRQLLAFARKQTIAPKVLNLNDTVSSMLSMLQRLIGEDISLAWVPGQHLWSIKIDPGQIDQILANMCVNASDAINGAGKIIIETQNIILDESLYAVETTCTPGKYVLLAVSDNGCGMDSETKNNIFDPFFTTKEIGKGTGFGLSTVYGIVKQNHGAIIADSEVGQGTTFKIYFHKHEDTTTVVPNKLRVEVPDGNETILVVEDDSSVLEMTKRMLEISGYQVLTINDPRKAVEVATNFSDTIDLLLTDVIMPDMNGRDLADKLTLQYPCLKILYMSGYTANVIANHGILDEGLHFIQKPFTRQNLTVAVRNVLDE